MAAFNQSRAGSNLHWGLLINMWWGGAGWKEKGLVGSHGPPQGSSLRVEAGGLCGASQATIWGSWMGCHLSSRSKSCTGRAESRPRPGGAGRTRRPNCVWWGGRPVGDTSRENRNHNTQSVSSVTPNVLNMCVQRTDSLIQTDRQHAERAARGHGTMQKLVS